MQLFFFGQEANVVSGAAHVSAVWRSRVLDTKPAAVLALTRLFATPARALRFWAEDDSGTNPRPHPHSRPVPSDQRLYYHTHRTTHAFMTGKSLKQFADRFQGLLVGWLDRQPIGAEWTELEDLHGFVQTMLATAGVEAMCGPTLLRLNPGWVHDFWTFDAYLPKFLGGLPWLRARTGYLARRRCLEGIKAWHRYAQQHFDPSQIAADGHDPCFGSSLMRSRQEMWAKMPAMDADAAASEDLGIIWGENSNSIPAAFWSLVHIFRDPELLRQTRVQADKSATATAIAADTAAAAVAAFDTEGLTRNPLLQSVWSEVLRLYVALFIVRGADHDAFTLPSGHTVPPKKMIVVDTHTAHMDPAVWNAAKAPLDAFQADRFLVYPERPESGPLRAEARPAASPPVSSPGTPPTPLTPPSACAPATEDPFEPRFSASGLSGSLIAFGGGRHSCPGRAFAKQEVLLCVAVLTALFDIEIPENADMGTDLNYYGLGSLPPRSKMPVRIRRRQGPTAA